MVESVLTFMDAMRLPKQKPIDRDLLEDGTRAVHVGGSVNAWSEAISRPANQDSQIQGNLPAAQSWLNTVTPGSKAHK
jgi:hypothetical protein